MSGRAFLDTNIFVYSVDAAGPEKQQRAQRVLSATQEAVVSTQVMNEFYVVSTRKLRAPLSTEDAAAIVKRMAALVCVSIDPDLVQSAIRVGQRWQLSHGDALMVEAARRADCDRLLSEDLSGGAVYDGLRIENPLLG